MIDWRQVQDTLVRGTEAPIRRFLAEHSSDTLCAVGYVFELWNYTPQFNLCANTRRYFDESIVRYRSKCPEVSQDQIRWNSGDFQSPAGLTDARNELSPEWSIESTRLHTLADEDQYSQEVYDGLITIACNAIEYWARRGLFGDWSMVDFNISEVGDGIEKVKERDQHIRQILARSA